MGRIPHDLSLLAGCFRVERQRQGRLGRREGPSQHGLSRETAQFGRNRGAASRRSPATYCRVACIRVTSRNRLDRISDGRSPCFLGAFARLVVAAAVWYQIKTATEQLSEERMRADQARNDRLSDMKRLSDERAADLARTEAERNAELTCARRERDADAIVEVVAQASNASNLYIQTTLRPSGSRARERGSWPEAPARRRQVGRARACRARRSRGPCPHARQGRPGRGLRRA
jgi:hypothetical protein